MARPGGETSTGARDRLFVGSAVARYDIDELDTLAKRPRQEKYVEVRRPDGSVAKARGERTFYGAFTGGFSAGYWNTVGSKEGWAPASFSSSRKQRAQHSQRVEDFMDDEDLQEHQSSHRTIAPQEEFMPKGPAARGVASALPGGLPKDLEQVLFPSRESSLGSRLLQAAKPSGGQVAAERDAPKADAGLAEALLGKPTASSASAPPVEKDRGKKRYGCARPPSLPGVDAGIPTVVPEGRGDENALDRSNSAKVDLQVVEDSVQVRKDVRFHKATSTSDGTAIRMFEARLEQLWQAKTDRHGVGYGQGFVSSKGIPVNRRLYMSSKKARTAKGGQGYGAFGTGVFDMEDHDDWEDVYEGDYSKQVDYDHMLKDADVEEEARGTALHDIATTSHSASAVLGEVPGFVEAAEEEADATDMDLAQWAAPPVPRRFRGIHQSDGNGKEEAKAGSKEHRLLLEFLERHGPERLMKPNYRAELLGEKAREGSTGTSSITAASASSTAPLSSNASAGQQQAPLPPTTESALSVAPPAPPGDGSSTLALSQPAPLWNASSAAAKEALLKSLGRSFVVGETQDMDGKLARHQPFNSDVKKQQRYARFCLALEGKASASEALKDDGGLTAAAREAELEEFGRVYRTFRQENPDAKLHDALNISSEVQMAPVLRREVCSWQPERLLCKRWGVPPPTNFQGGDLPCTQRQKAYQEQVKNGLAKITSGAGNAAESGKPAWEPPPQALQEAAAAAHAAGLPAISAPSQPQVEAPRPPKSLFSAIFGDGDVDEALDAG
mmetsp:Transcript_60953/g.145248  ORF Transcript_60953/g.145248 Transcript_60953/m.145248 type:complete len:783 (+) Transcript_60953:45-2393(+)